MVRHIQKKLLGRMSYGLLMVMGSVGHTTYGSGQTHFPSVLPNFNDTYLGAVRVGDVATVRQCLQNRALNVNAVDTDGNTDIMLAIKGGEKDDFDPSYQQIFDLLIRIQEENRNWNWQNNRGQTALLLSVGWGRFGCLEALLGRPEVDPNIPNIDGATPLVAAIATRQIDIALRLINDPRVNVNRRGTDNKLPLQVAAEAGLLEQLANPICRRSLIDYDLEVKRLMRQMLWFSVSFLPGRGGERLLPEQTEAIVNESLDFYTSNPVFSIRAVGEHIDTVLNHQQAVNVHQAIAQNAVGVIVDLVALSLDPRVNVDGYACPVNQIVEAIRGKSNFLLTQLAARINLGDFDGKLRRIEWSTQLFNNFLTRQNFPSLTELFTQLQ